MSYVDLFSLASSGVNASSKLLQTTSNNIANVNTPGYVRERTELKNSHVFGVEIGNTERIINVFAQNQLRRDITSVGELESFSQKTSTIDNLLASESSSVTNGLSGFFAALQTAADDPTNLASREVVLSKSESLFQRMKTLSDFMVQKENELNLEFNSLIERANTLIGNIGDLNKNIVVAYGNSTSDQPSALLNERDKAIDELASIMGITVQESRSQNGAVTVNLTSGESLVLENGEFNLFETTTNADLLFKELTLQTDHRNPDKGDASIPVIESEMGGALGGLFRYRNEILGPAIRDLGQISIAFADAMNSQNKLGMDLDGQLGGNIYDIPTFHGLPYEDTTGNYNVTAQLVEGKGAELTDADYKIEVTAVTAGVPTAITLTLLNPDGTVKTDGSGADLEFVGLPVTGGTIELTGGIEVDFSGPDPYIVGNEFLIQPTKTAASDISLATNRPEDLAFANPARVQESLSNLGSASVTSVVTTNTSTAGGVGDSAFDGAQDIDATAPRRITFTSPNSYQIFDDSNNLLATVTGATDLNNLIQQAKDATGIYAGFDDYPGYDFSLEGIPQPGDSFVIEYNKNGFNDNSNALEMASLQNDGKVQVSSESTNKARTFQDAYASLVGRVGEDASTANISLTSAEAMKVQSKNWFDSVSGVSLDEEAASLIKYQQSYAAAARILSTAQDLFNTILQSAR